MTDYTLDSLAEEQEALRLPRFDYDIAWEIGCHIRAAAAERDLPISIQVTHGLDLVFSVLMPSATSDNLHWAARKRATTHRFHRSSLAMRLMCEDGGFDLAERFRLDPTAFVASGGCLPLMLQRGTLIGTVAVSGLPDVEDHRLGVAALKHIIG